MTEHLPVQPDPAQLGEVSGRAVVLAYSSAASEYEKLRKGAVVIDRSFRGRTFFGGEKAGETLTGLVTADVLALRPGHGCYAAALSPKGRILADVRVFALEDGFLVDVPARAAEGWWAMVRKYVNPRVTPYRDEAAALSDVGVFGPDGRRVIEAATGIAATALTALPPYGHATVAIDGARTIVASVPDAGVEGFELIAPPETVAALWPKLVGAGASPAGLEAWEIARVEAGRPEWGVDIDDTTIPQEANLDELQAISYTKGCYTGQEVVARVHFRGHVNRHLRGLRSAALVPPPTGAALVDADGRPVGDVRSAVASPRLGGIALGMVRREVEPGAALTAKWDGGELRVDVCALPFAG